MCDISWCNSFHPKPSVVDPHVYVSNSLCGCGSVLYSVLHSLVIVDYAITYEGIYKGLLCLFPCISKTEQSYQH